MRLILLILLCASVVGCGGSRTLNPGAPIEIRLQTHQELASTYPQFQNLGGATEFRFDKIIVTLPRGVDDQELVRVTLHEIIKHVLPRLDPATEPACKRLLELMTTDKFNPIICAPRSNHGDIHDH
jgi:hypothetical protein